MLTYSSLFLGLLAIFINLYALLLCVDLLEKWHELDDFRKNYSFIMFFIHIYCIAINVPPLLC